MRIPLLIAVVAILVTAGAWRAAEAGTDSDADQDGVWDPVDFCSSDPSAPFPCGLDSDNDGYGNACDGDFDNDGATDGLDVAPFGAGLASGGPGPTDMNCDGATDGLDVGPFGAQLGAGSPGPSGLACAGTVPCP